MTVTFAESCTGGLCAANITKVSGASQVFKGSAVTYSEQIKSKLVGVTKDTLDKHTVYSKECAREMCLGAKDLFCADVAIGITGIAGPSGATENDPVGTVYIAVARGNGCVCERFVFEGDRERVRESAALKAFEMAVNTLIYSTKKES